VSVGVLQVLAGVKGLALLHLSGSSFLGAVGIDCGAVGQLILIYFCVKVRFLSWSRSYQNVHWDWLVLRQFLHDFAYCFCFVRGSKSLMLVIY